MADEVTTGEETKETAATETDVDVTALDDAALDAQLAADDDGTPAQTDEEKPETETQTETETSPSEVQTVAETADEEKARLEKQVKAKEEFIGRQTNEIGELRRQAQTLQDQLAAVNQEELNDRYYNDPTTAVNEVLAVREAQAQVQRLNMLANIKQNEIVVKEYVPDFDDLMDDMVETLKELKYDDEIIKNFKVNPYAEQPAIIVNLAARARLAKENTALKAEIEGLKQKVKTGPEDALKKVEKAARQVVTGATGKSGGADPVRGNIHQMTDAQLDAILNSPDDE